MNPSNELQGLNYLDVTGNEHWLPSKQVLQLSNLTTVEGVRLSQHCKDCSLCKVTSDDANSSCSRDHRLSAPSNWRWPGEIQYGKALDFIKLGFWPTCLEDYLCKIDQFALPLFTSLYNVARKSSFALYATGPVALLVNIAVVVFIAFNKSLRKDLAIRLLLNIAVCDALIALVSVLYTRFNFAIMYTEYLRDQLRGNYYGPTAFGKKWEKLANIIGPILTCAVTSQVFGSGISMLDKFLKIVFAMRPRVRLGSKAAVLSLCFSWSLSATFAVLPVFGIGGMAYVGSLMFWPHSEDDRWEKPMDFATGTLVIVQLASFLLYVPIFIVAKKSGANVGVKREAAIARKIALLICTNLIFFTAPVVVSLFQTTMIRLLNKDISEGWRSPTLREIQWRAFLLSTLPILCLSINSLLNPFLYALRHPKVKQQLNPLLSRCGATLRECFGTLRQNLRCRTTTD